MATARIGAYLERPPLGGRAVRYAKYLTFPIYMSTLPESSICPRFMYVQARNRSFRNFGRRRARGEAAQRRVTQNLKIAHFGGNNHPAKVGSPTPIGDFSDVPSSLTPPSWDNQL